MNAATIDRTVSLLDHGPDKAITLALSLAQAERAVLAFTAGQVDAVVDADGQAYLLRPAQQQLLQEAGRLRAILDSSPDAITVLSRAGVILEQHGAAGGLPGMDREDLIGRSIFTLIHDEDLTRLYSAFFNIAEGLRGQATVHFRLRDGMGAWQFFEGTAGRMPYDASASVVLVLRPIPDARPVLVAKPRQAAAVPPVAPAKDRFLSMLSHELRTPLTPVLLGIEELLADDRFTEARPVLDMIRRNVDLQGRLLDELMEFTLVGQHKVRLRLEPLDLHAHIGYVLETCRSELTAAQITVLLDFDACPRESLVCADSLRFQQVMWNLVKNAIKFSPPGSSILIVTADHPAGHVTIDFTDQGIGIEPGLLGLVFDAFQQGSLAQQRNKGGLGLGLFIAKGLAEAQDGTLTVHSEGSGLGSTFRLVLPKAPADGSGAPVESSSLFSAAALRPAGQASAAAE